MNQSLLSPGPFPRVVVALLVAPILMLLETCPAMGQTPWQAAPATPPSIPSRAPTTNSSTFGARVANLPPPPSSRSGAVATPPYMPIGAAPAATVAASENLSEGLADLLPPAPAATNQAAVSRLAVPPLNAANISPNASGGSPKLSIAMPPLPNLSGNGLGMPSMGAAQGTSTQANGQLVAFDFNPVQPPPLQEFAAGQLVAVVGTDPILAGDMAVFVEPIIEQNRDRITTSEEEAKIRSQLVRQALRQYVEVKAIYQEFFRDMVGTVTPKELEETKKKVVSKAGKIFFDKQVPVLQKKYQVASIQELELKLQTKSLSLMTLRGQFIEQVLASELERKYVPEKFEISREDLLIAYRDEANRQKWNVAGRARWRQLTIRFDKHTTREEANLAIRELGNQIFLGGKPFEAAAKQSSEGFTASDGGVYDWTTQGSLKSKQLDEAIFALPLNRLSQVIEDDIGLHIIEVLEREPGHTMDFTQAQADLRESLSNQRRNKEVRAFREKIMARTPVWTLWPEDIPGSRPLTDALGSPSN